MKLTKQSISLVAVTLALFLSLAYIGVSEYQKMKNQEQLSAYQQGVVIGYQQAVIQLLNQVSTCQQVPVTYENLTINVIAVECLQQAQNCG
jgi:hypothetical protein